MTLEMAQRLCAYRKLHGLSQEQLAEKIGISRQAVSKWERAEASPDTDNLIALSKVYGVTLDELLFSDPDEPQAETTQETAECDEESSVEDERPKISFRDGIHIDSKNGDRVDVGFSGVRVESRTGERVHVGFDGIYVDEGGSGHVVAFHARPRWYKQWQCFPWALLCLAVYLLAGFCDVLGGWAFGWIVFLTVLLYHSLGAAIYKRRASRFCYPALAAMVYLIAGACGCWHPSWIVFLTVPLYYGVCGFITKCHKGHAVFEDGECM